MNLLHLKYAVEVAKTSSITKAAENLYMGQPNLSRAIRELEEDLGIEIFIRSSKGITPTPQGEEFLRYARSILAQVDAVEKRYREKVPSELVFSVSVPRASYISCAFTDFVEKLDSGRSMELLYKETNAMRAVQNILESNYRLGIVRYLSVYDRQFKELLAEKGLTGELIWEFRHEVLASENSPLAAKETYLPSDLSELIEIAHGDPFVPSVPVSEVRREEMSGQAKRRIFVFERGSQFDLLSRIPESFMLVSPVPERLLKKHGLVLRRYDEEQKKYRDLLIYKKDYKFTDTDLCFIDELMKYKRMLS